jgi:glycosyltransferase involved in cell wall biosynthesis
MPKVSVIIPTYNSAQYVGAAVDSVLAQTFTDYETIVVDDGSTDETREVLQRYARRITYIYQENRERSAARNAGINASSGKYIAFLDADDLWMPHKIERQVAVLDENPTVALCYCQASYIDPNGSPVQFLGSWIYGDRESKMVVADKSRELMLGNVVFGGGSTPMVRRSLLEEVGLFDETLSYPEDWDLWIRLSRKGPFAYIPEPLACYRVYGWHKVLVQQASERLVAQHLRVIEKAVATWHGETDEQMELRAQAMGMVYIRAALANYQLGRAYLGSLQLEKAISVNPKLMTRDFVRHLAVDRAKLIEIETGSHSEAQAFIKTFFSNLPPRLAHLRRDHGDAVGHLYLVGAFEKHRSGDRAAVRRLLIKGIIRIPAYLKNLGVLSIALEAFFGKTMAQKLRRLAFRIFRWQGGAGNA